jgi:hypothetical protein
MYEQMVNYVSRNGFISSFHSGFRPGHRTATAIAWVSDDSRLNMESNQPMIFVLVDFSKAFDCVCHELFILKLRQRYGFYATAATLVSFYLFPQGSSSVTQGYRISPLSVFLCLLMT